MAAAANVQGVMQLENVFGGHHNCAAAEIVAANGPPPILLCESEDTEELQALVDELGMKLKMMTATAQEVPSLRVRLDQEAQKQAPVEELEKRVKELEGFPLSGGALTLSMCVLRYLCVSRCTSLSLSVSLSLYMSRGVLLAVFLSLCFFHYASLSHCLFLTTGLSMWVREQLIVEHLQNICYSRKT